MSQVWPWIAGALVVFWLVGLHSRLLRLRAAVFEATSTFERTMQTLIAVARDAVPPAQSNSVMGTVLLQSAAALEAGLKQHKSSSWARRAAPAALDLGALWAHLQQAWLAHTVAVEGVCDPATLQALRERWDKADAHGPLARMAANQAIAAYENALAQAPAVWVARALGFRRVLPLR
jgi:hypothetical protein